MGLSREHNYQLFYSTFTNILIFVMLLHFKSFFKFYPRLHPRFWVRGSDNTAWL